MKLTNKVYDVMKWIARYLLPGLGTLYFALAGIWGFPYGEEIVGTITAVDAFLGLILGISSATYEGDGMIYGEGDEATIVLGDKDAMEGKKYVTLKVTDEKFEE